MRVFLTAVLLVGCLSLSPIMAMAEEGGGGGFLRNLMIKRMAERQAEGAGDVESDGTRKLGYKEQFETPPEDDRYGWLDDDITNGDSCPKHHAATEKKLNGALGKMAARRRQIPDYENVAYGSAEREVMDIFLPKTKAANGQPAPILVMVHGGGWCVGDKSINSTPGDKTKRWTPKGFMFIALNYPMIMNGKNAIEQAQSVAKAIAYIQKNAAKWGGDGQRVIIMGHSAGGHLVSLVNADADLRKQAGMKPILGTLSIDPGAVNLPTQMGYVIKGLHTRYIEAFGRDPKGWEAASPYHQLDKTAAPWLGICSTKRPDDPCGQAEEYAKKSNSLGIKAQPLAIAKSHKAINQDLGKPEQYTYDVEKFMASLDPVVAKLLSSQ